MTADKRARRWAVRTVFLVHRWLGILLALLMAVWAVSGIVMMYVSFPETSREEQLAGLEPLAFVPPCCADIAERLGGGPVEGASVEMLGGEPVLRWRDPRGGHVLALATGSEVITNAAGAEAIVQGHMQRTTGASPNLAAEPIDRDQWTVYGRFRALAPLYKVTVADDRGTVLYVSGKTGEVVQDTNARERFWNWLGAVPHWLYFTALREIQPLWYNLVVYASVLGTFLTATGIYIGIRQYGRGKRRSPYRGIALWHHWTGLIFGLFTLTWVVSGLFSMQPWGWFESSGPGEERAALAGREIEPADVARFVTALSRMPASDAVSARLAIDEDKAFVLLSGADSSQRRTALDGSAAPLGPRELQSLASRARPNVAIADQQMITTPDAYYYGHHDGVVLPAWRVIYADDEAVRLYFDPRTGELLRKVDAAGRAYRWWHYGLHRFDFFEGLRGRPVWDIVVVPLMLGVSLLCLVGLWMGVRYFTRRRPRSG